MSPITEQQIKQRLRGLPDGGPDYDAMWNRIRTEAERRRSGWSEQASRDAERPSPARARRWIAAASVAAILVAAGGTALYFEQRTEHVLAPAAPAGQRIEASAEVDGIKLTLENAVIGKRVYDQENRLALQLRLSGLDGKTFDYASFKQGTVTDLDSGQSIAMQKTGFDARKGTDNLTITQYVQDNLPAAGEARHYRLEMSDLYLTGRSEVPIAGKMIEGTEYDVLPERDLRIKLLAYDWVLNGTELNLEYEASGAEPLPEDYDPASPGYEGSSYLTVKNGTDLFSYSSAGAGGERRTQSFSLPGLTETERDHLQFVYSYAETVGKVEGTWTIDFTVEASQASTPAYTVALKDQAAFEDRTELTMSEVIVSPFEVRIPIVRPEASAELRSGQFLTYGKIELEGEDFEAWGFHTPIPGLASDALGASEDESEKIYFDLQDDQIQDLSDQSLTLKLRDAIVYNEYPDVWTPIASPEARARTASETMPDRSAMAYKIVRKGADIQVTTTTGNAFYMISGTTLRVDGKTYTRSDSESYGKYNGDTGFRIDVFKNVPQGAEFSINAGSYGVYDSSRDLDIPLQH